MKIVVLTAIAMLAFAANSVLARLAFATANAEPLSYTGIRLASGAIVLAVLLLLRRRPGTPVTIGGSWRAAAALFGYALALVSPGLVAPHPLGTLLMVGSGLCWAAYTLLGRGSKAPLVDTAGNFIRCLPVALAIIITDVLLHPVDPGAAAYAAASGALASGLGYAVWYAVLPSLARTQAAVVQLTVPAIAAAGGVLLIAEPLTARLVIASIGILGGVALALVAAERRRRAEPAT